MDVELAYPTSVEGIAKIGGVFKGVNKLSSEGCER